MNVMIVPVQVIQAFVRPMHTYEKNFIGQGMHKDVEEYVMHCQKCQVNKVEHLKAGGLLHPLERTWISMD